LYTGSNFTKSQLVPMREFWESQEFSGEFGPNAYWE